MLDIHKVLSGEELVRLGEVPVQAVRTEADGAQSNRPDAPTNASKNVTVSSKAGKSKS
jgi:hypothetical protein